MKVYIEQTTNKNDFITEVEKFDSLEEGKTYLARLKDNVLNARTSSDDTITTYTLCYDIFKKSINDF